MPAGVQIHPRELLHPDADRLRSSSALVIPARSRVRRQRARTESR